MAIIKVFTRKNNLKNLIDYVSNFEKTQNGILISGKDCSVHTACIEMQTVKEIYNKTDGNIAFHFIQSFSPNDNLSYEKTHELGLKFAEYFKDFQVLVATHTDQKHLHNHLVVNSVSFETGKKLHISKNDLKKIKEFSNKLCEENGLETIDLEEHNTVTDISKNELAIAKKGQSWKFKLINDIDYCISISNTKDEYIDNMKKLNYKVVWTDERKYITYTTPDGNKCRDKSLHDTKYLKEEMENGFSRNKKIEPKFNTNEERKYREQNTCRDENRIIYSTDRISQSNTSMAYRNKRYIYENGFTNKRPIDTGANWSQTRELFTDSFNRQSSTRNSLSNERISNSTRNINKMQNKEHYERTSSRNCYRYYCNTSLETLRHIASLIQNFEYVGPPLKITHCFGDLSKQARKEWYIKHINSNSFDWFEDDFEI